MKKIWILILPLSFSIGCNHLIGNAISNSIRNSRYVVVKDVSLCKFSGAVTTWHAPNSRKMDDAPLMAIGVLKREILESRLEGNSISNIHMTTDRDFPKAKADLFICPEEIFEKSKPLQNDKEFLYSNIIFDLKMEDMPNKPSR